MSNYVLRNGTFYEASDDELMHYGVKGMKWGVRKEEYAAMNRNQKKKTRQEYYKTDEGKVRKIARNSIVGTVLGGPLVGATAGLITAKRNPISQEYKDRQRAKLLNGKKYADSYIEKMATTSVNELKSGHDKTIVRKYKDYEKGSVTNMSKALTSKTPYYALSDREKNSISRSYEDRRASLTKQRNAAKTPEQKQKILDQIDELELDYLEIVERDW